MQASDHPAIGSAVNKNRSSAAVRRFCGTVFLPALLALLLAMPSVAAQPAGSATAAGMGTARALTVAPASESAPVVNARLAAGSVAASAPANAATSAATGVPTEAAGLRAYWVFFRDRGGVRVGEQDLLRIAESIPAEAWARRTNSAAPLPDVRDAGLWAPYVSGVARCGKIRNRSRWLNAVSAELTPLGLKAVRALPYVTRTQLVAAGKLQSIGPGLGPDGRPLEKTLPHVQAPAGVYPYGPSWGQLNEIGVPPVQALGYTGNRVRLMMLDAGFRKDHDAFRHARILAEWDFVFHDGDTQDQPDDYPGAEDHGTGTWSVNGGYDPGHIVGPAYGATFVLSKTEDIRSETRVEEDNFVAALEWADSLGVSVTSASLAYTCFDDGFCYNYPLKNGDYPVTSHACEIAAARGILCVNAAGNYGPAPMSLGTPGDADSTVSVGAVDSLNNIASFSSRGPTDDLRTKPEVVARGLYTWWADANDPGAYGYASGTSLSTPLVSGAAALLCEVHPEWGPEDIRKALMMTADRHTSPDNTYGWGRVNLAQAIYYTPILFPVPFSLASPADSVVLTTISPTFTWRSSRDLQNGTRITYTLRIRQAPPGTQEWDVPAGPDTTLSLGFGLEPAAAYTWDVSAEDGGGYRRISRETDTFIISGAAGAGPSSPWSGFAVTVGPNPSTGNVAFQVQPASKLSGARLEWAVYDPVGRRLASAEVGPTQGMYRGVWDGLDLSGSAAPAGVYFLELRLGPETARRTLVRLGASNSTR